MEPHDRTSDEIERLRSALRKIVDTENDQRMDPTGFGYEVAVTVLNAASKMRAIAQAALEPT